MPSNNDPVKPIPFDVVTSAPSPTTTAQPAAAAAADRDSSTRMWLVLAAMAVLALLVVFWLPSMVQTPDHEHEATTAQTPQANSSVDNSPQQTAEKPSSAGQAPAGPDVSPWSDAQAARMRKQAQEVLNELLDVQFALQERGVEQWAPAQFAEVKAIAADADALYKNREYEKAVARYQQGLAALKALQDGMPAQLKQLLAQAQQALDAGDATTATTALATAAIIAPDDADIKTLRHRVEVLPQVTPLLHAAEIAEATGNLAQAEQLLTQVTKLDPQHQLAASQLQRISARSREEGFNAAMSKGYAALNQGQFDSARDSFNAAAKLQPGSAEAASALKEVQAAQTSRQLASLDKQGRQNEQQEQWQKAVSAYEQAQKLDRSVVFASEGLTRSRARAQLDTKLRTVLNDPHRLSDTAVAAATAQLLAQAQQVTPRGPVLAQQITKLETLLRQANTTVAVTLRSDKQTDVTVYKIAKLGRFAEHELTLRPGTYTALGTRIGYRDVRQNFTISAGNTPAPVTIICTDPI